MERRFWTFLAGRTISVLGDGFGTIAMGWLVYELTGSKLAMGSLYLAGMIPEITIRLIGAPLLDRLHRTRLMAFLDIIQMLAYLTPLLLWRADMLTLWHIYGLYVVAGCANALYRPAITAVLPSLVRPDQLSRANATMTGLLDTALVTGPTVAGFVTVYLHSASALALNAVTFGVSAAALLLLSSAIGRPAPQSGSSGTYWQQAIEGWAFFRQAPALFALSILLGLNYLSAWMIFSMHAPYVAEHLNAGPQILGAMQACWPLGFLLGSVLMGYVGEIRQRRRLMLTAMILTGIALGGLGLVPPGWVLLALACKVLEGFSFALFSNTSTVLFLRQVPDHLRGRVMSARLLLAWGGNPLGAFLGGYLGQQIGLSYTFMIAGALPILVGLVGFGWQVLHQVDGEPVPAQASA